MIGAVTRETPALVSPNGIAGLTFGDPVEAVNRVAAQLTDGDPSNGEADVIIAEYHEGAGAGTLDDATLEEELALTGSAFAEIVTQTSAEVDAIFNGHTHKVYAWDAQVPGATDGATRAVLQTGSYGENIGQVVLTYDSATDATTTNVNRNVARSTASDVDLIAAYPAVSDVDDIVVAARAAAAIVGNEPVGAVTSDITRACIDGAAPCVEDRSAPSALGSLVANSLRESLPSELRGSAQIGVVNPGGMRDNLRLDEDGVITYAEANAVLPFLNNLWTTTLTGAQFTTVLEQQWQTNADGTIPSRPFLALGLSDNVSYTYDADRAAGDRVTGVFVDGQPIDANASYVIGSFNFLLTGGDNFREFTQGTNTRDSGLVDRDAWIDYITANSPLSPSFAASQATVTGLPAAAVDAGDTLNLSVSNVDITSLGAPKNTEFTLNWVGSTASLGTASVDENGVFAVTVTVPADAAPNSVLELTSTATGTVVRVAISVTAAAVTPEPTPGTLPESGGPIGLTPETSDPTSTVVPSFIAVSAGLDALTAAVEDASTSDRGSYAAGASVSIHVGEQYAGRFVSVWLRSIPVNLGWHQVSPGGFVTVTIPEGTAAGSHRLIVQDTTGAVIGWTEIEVAPAGATLAALPNTGVDSTPLLFSGAFLLLLGAALMLKRRRTGLEQI